MLSFVLRPHALQLPLCCCPIFTCCQCWLFFRVTGGCSPFACMPKHNKQMTANPRPVPAPVKLTPVSQQQPLQHPLQQQQAPLQQLRKQQAVPATQKPANIQKPMPLSNEMSLFSRLRAPKTQKANKAFESNQNQLFVAAHTRQPAELIYDLQQPLIVWEYIYCYVPFCFFAQTSSMYFVYWQTRNNCVVDVTNLSVTV